MVKRWGTIRVANKVYSLPSRLLGHRVQVRLYANHLEVRCRGELVARPERVRGDGLDGIDYRHLVHSLMRKPGAFRRYVYREALFPTLPSCAALHGFRRMQRRPTLIAAFWKQTELVPSSLSD